MAVTNNFSASTLDLNNVASLSQPTALVWGPDGRLYVTEVDGDVKVLTVAFGDKTPGDGDATAQFYVTGTVTIDGVKSIPNFNDNGTVNGSSNRQVTGIDVTAQYDANGNQVFIGGKPAVTMYVTSSDSRIGAGGGGNDANLDTNSGTITKLTQTGPNSWDAVDIVRGLARSEENHATNGLEVIQTFDTAGKLVSERLIVANGGNANSGAPSNNFAGQQEQPYSAAILEIDLDAIKSMAVQTSPEGRKYVYDLPTLDDPTRAGAADTNDPHGGNDGLNSAKLTGLGPVQIYSPGYRNSYDIEVTEDGRVFTYDNGANNSWGGRPVGEAGDNGGTIDFAQALGYIALNLNNGEGNSSDDINLENWNPSNKDNFHEVTRSDDLGGRMLSAGQGGAQTYQDGGLTYVYGGHPNPTRAEGSRAGLLFSPKAGTDDAYLLVSDTDSFGNGGGSDYAEVIAWLTEVENNDANYPSTGIYGANAGDLTKKVLAVTPGVAYDIYKFADGSGAAVVQGGPAPAGGTLLGQAGLPADIAEIVANPNPLEGNYREAGKTDGALDTGNGSINGLTEYTSTVLDGAGIKMSGAIIAAQLGGGNLIVMGRDANGVMQTATSGGFSVAADRTVIEAGGSPLGLASIGDDYLSQGLNQAFQGSIWSAVYGQNGPLIEVFQPGNGAVPLAGSPIANPTDHDLDGIDHVADPFEFSDDNGYALGAGEQLVIDFNPQNTNFPTSLASTGLLGAALDGTTPNQDAQTAFEGFPTDQQRDGLFDIGGNVLPGGNAPILQIKKVAEGTVVGSANSARDVLHTGIRPGGDVDRLVVTADIKNWIPAAGGVAPGQLTGLIFGDGTQANFLRFVFGSVNGVPGFEIGYEIDDTNYQVLARVGVPALANVNVSRLDLRLEIATKGGFGVNAAYRLEGESGFTDIDLGGFGLPVGVLRDVLTGNHTIGTGAGAQTSGAAIGFLAETSAGNALDAIDFNGVTIEAFGNEIPATTGAQVGQQGSADVDTVIYTGSDTDLAPLAGNVENFDGRSSTADYTVTGNALDNTILVGSGANTVTTGAGADSVRGTSARLDGDTITDFSQADEVIVTDASLAGLDVSYAAGSARVTLNGSTTIAFTGPGFADFDPATGADVFGFTQTAEGLRIALVPSEVVLYRVNAGPGTGTGGTITAIDGGPDWISDASVVNSAGPVSLTGATTNTYTQGLTDSQAEIDLANVDAATVPWQLFVFERSDNTNDASKITYNFDVETGKTYKITLLYAENWNNIFGSAGGRQFDVSVEDSVPAAFTGIDPLAEAAAYLGQLAPTSNGATDTTKQPFLGTAFARNFVYTAGDDTLTLQFEHGVQNPKINAIQISQLGGGGGVTPTDTAAPVIASIEVDNPASVQDGVRTATVVITDEIGIDAAALAGLDGSELSFSGIVPDSVSVPQISISANGKTATLSYTLSAPGNAWPSGQGAIAIAAGAYADAAGNPSGAASGVFILEPNLANLVAGEVALAINVGPVTNSLDTALEGSDKNTYGGAITGDTVINGIDLQADDPNYYSPATKTGSNIDGKAGGSGSNSGLDGSALHTYRDSAAGSFTATYPIENGVYVVELWFAELFHQTAGQRQGDYTINGETFELNFDAFTAAGTVDTPTKITKNVAVTNGQIVIDVNADTGQPGFNAIVVYEAIDTLLPPTVSVGDVTAVEGGTAEVTFTRAGDASQAVTVSYALGNDSAGAEDYAAPAGSSVVIPAGTRSVTLPISIIDDTEEEGAESFTVTITGVTNAAGNAAIGTATARVEIAASDARPDLPTGGVIFDLDFETPGGALDAGGFDGALGGSAAIIAADATVADGKLKIRTAEGDINEGGAAGGPNSKNDFTKSVDLSDPGLNEITLATRFANPFPAALAAQGITNGIVPNFAQQGIVFGLGSQAANEMVKLVFGGVANGNGVQMWSKGLIDQKVTLFSALAPGKGLADVAEVELALVIDKAAGTVAQVVTFFDASGVAIGGVRPEAVPGFATVAPLAMPQAVLDNLVSGATPTQVGVTSNDYGAGLGSFEASWDFLRLSSPGFTPADDALVSIAGPGTITEGGNAGIDALVFTLSAEDGVTGPLDVTLSIDGATGTAQSVVFTNGSGTISVPVAQDSRWNGDESVSVEIVSIATPGYAVDPAAAFATGTVSEDDTPDTAFGTQIGDFSDDRADPTDLGALALGDNVITATQQGDTEPGGRDRDYITVEVPEGQVLTQIVLQGYVSDETTQAGFIAIQAGNAVTTDPVTGASSGDLLGGLIYGEGLLGNDILAALAAGGNQQGTDFPGFDLPLPAGTYTLWLNQGGAPSSATLNLISVEAPMAEFTISIADAGAVTETGDTGSTTLEFPLTASTAFTGDLTINYDTSAATGLSALVSFTDGAGVLAIEVPNDDENTDDALSVTLTGVSGADVELGASVTASGTVTEDDTLDPTDIDGDGVINTADPFAYDGTNGLSKVLIAGGAFRQDFNEDTTDLFSTEAGFSGIMINPAFAAPGSTAADPYGDRTTEATSFVEGGFLKVQSSETDSFSTGIKADNTLKDNYQSGADVTGVESFSVEAKAFNPFVGGIPAQYAGFGITLGAGGTDDYVKFVLGGSGSTPRLQLANEDSLTGLKEENIVLNAQTPPIVEEDIAAVVFRLDVSKPAGSPATLQGTATLLDASGAEIAVITTTERAITGSLAAALENQNPLTGGTGGIAYGIAVTDWSNGDSNRFTGNWDYLTLSSAGPENQAPSAVVLTPVAPTLSEAADTSAAITVATIAVTDDGLGSNALTLSGTDADLFEIFDNSGSLELRLKAGTTLDFEANPALDVTVEVEDATVGATPDAQASFTVALSDVDETTPPATSIVRIQGETFDRATNYATQVAAAADGGRLIWVSAKQQSGTAEYDLGGKVAPGTYRLAVGHFDENDGESRIVVSVASGGTETFGGSFVLDDDATSGGAATALSFRVKVFENVTVGEDGVLTLTGLRQGGEHVRVDYVEFTRITGDPTGNLPPQAPFGIENQSLAQTATLDLDVADLFADPEEDPLTFTVEGADWITVVDGRLTGTPGAANVGTNTVTVVASDGVNIVRVEFDVTVTAVNTPPVTTGIGNQIIAVGADIDFAITDVFSDADLNDVLTYAVTGTLPAGITFENGIFSGAATQPGSFQVQVTASDGEADISSSFVFNVLPSITRDTLRIEAEDFTLLGQGFFEQTMSDGRGTVIRLLKNRTGEATFDLDNVGASGSYDARVAFYDENDGASSARLLHDAEGDGTFVELGSWVFDKTAPGQPTTLRVVTLPGLEVTSTSVLKLVATSNDGEFARIDYVELVPTGASVNFAPFVSNGIDDLTLENAAAIAIDLDATNAFGDPEEDALSYAIVSGPAWLTIENGVIGGIPTETGTFQVVVGATDGAGNSGVTVQTRFNVTVNSVDQVNLAPTGVTLSNAALEVSDTADTSAAIKVADIVVADDGLGTNVLGLTGADADLFEIVDDALFLKAGVALDASTDAALDVTVTVDDAAVGATPDASATLTIAVVEGNAAPTISGPAMVALPENTTAVASFTAADADAADTLTFGLAGADAALFAIDAAGKLSFVAAPDFETPGDAGGDNVYDVAVTVTDGTATASQSVAVTIDDVDETIAGDPLAPEGDLDGDTIANSADPDIDGDQIGNAADLFAYDSAADGHGIVLADDATVRLDFDTPGTPYQNGLTGVMLGTSTDAGYVKDTGAGRVEGGQLVVPTTSGDTGGVNTPQNDYSFGIRRGGDFSVETVIDNPFGAAAKVSYQQLGLAISLDSTDFVKFVAGNVGGAFEFSTRNNDVETKVTAVLPSGFTLFGSQPGTVVDKLKLVIDVTVDANGNAVATAMATILDASGQPVPGVGTIALAPLDLVGDLESALANASAPVAVGVTHTNGTAASFDARFDYLEVTADGAVVPPDPTPTPPSNVAEIFTAIGAETPDTPAAGQVGSAVLKVTAGGGNVQQSNYGANSFTLENTGDKKIAAMFIDVTDALYSDSVFDDDGSGGDSVAKAWAFNSGQTGAGGITPTQYQEYWLPVQDAANPDPLFGTSGDSGKGADGGWRGAALKFSASANGGFEKGEIVGFSGDMDPNSIAGYTKATVDSGTVPGGWDVGGVSGAELIGSKITVLFTDGTTGTGQLVSDKSQAGAQALITQAAPAGTATLAVNGTDAGGVGSYGDTLPEVIVGGPAGSTIRVTMTKGIQPVGTDAANAKSTVEARLADEAFKANNAVEFQSVDIKLGAGETSRDISSLFQYSNDPNGYAFAGNKTLPLGFVASVIDPASGLATGPVTKPLYLNSTGTPVASGNDGGTGQTGYYLAQNNRIKAQFEDLAGGANAPAGWVYETAATGNNPGFQGPGYYYWKDELSLGIESTPNQGLVTMKIYVEEAGTYSLRVRSARDSNDPGDARNDIWVKVDASTDTVVPDSFAPLLTKNGFTKLYKAQTSWGFADKFGTKLETDPKPTAAVELEKGFHTITFAGRSVGLHVDYVELFKGAAPAVSASNTVFIEGNEPPGGGTVTPPTPTPGDAQSVSIKAGSDDWEQYGGAGSNDLELGFSGTRPGYVGLRFSGLDIPAGAEIESAYLEFRADDASSGAANFTIALQNSTNVATYSSGSNPGVRSYLGQTASWNVETWQEGQIHRSTDVSALITQLIGSGGLETSEALGFRITGTGQRSADSFEASGGTAPKLVIKLKEASGGDPGTGDGGTGGGTLTPGTTSATIRASADDWEERGFGASNDLEFGLNGSNPQYVGLRFSGLDVPDGADITSAYFQFEAIETSTGAASFAIAIEDTLSAAGYTEANNPGVRNYLAETVAWSGVETWQDGQSYRSADISSLIEAVIDAGGIDALDTLAFRVTGTGSRAAHASDSDGDAPILVINYEDLA